jgi:hypothetical protein
MDPKREGPSNPQEFMRRYPRVTAHIIAESLGYATPTKAAMIGLHGMRDEPDWCEWIMACYRGNARGALEDAIRKRRYHKGFMCDYKAALFIVRRMIGTGDEPLLASWF